jgi:Pvc16 N-terminal domain
MPMLDLSQATIAIQRLLQFNIPLLEPGLAGTLTISTLRPELVEGGANVLSLYCYHVSPDGSNRYRPRQPPGPRPIATSPLTLILNYIVTAHTVIGTEFNALAEQRLLGYAMKTLHDYPVIDDSTRVDGQIVMPDEIRGLNNSFSITQLKLTAGEALNYWANETQITVKPSCYYEVVAAELTPEPPQRLAGIVLQIGSFVFPKSTPAIAASSSQVPYTRPASMGGGAASLTASPARVGPVTAAPPPPNVMRLTGRAFTAGDTPRQLYLTLAFWARQFPGGRVPVDLGLNGGLGWALAVADDEVEVTMGNDLRATPPDGSPAVDLLLYPGSYLASWEITRRFERDGVTERLAERSNTYPFMVYPRVTGSVRDNATGHVTLSFGGSWLLTRGRPPPPDPTTAPELDILLSVDGRAYRLVTDPAPTDPGTFTIAAHAMTYAPVPEADTPGDHALRVVIDGADSQPFWVAIP